MNNGSGPVMKVADYYMVCQPQNEQPPSDVESPKHEYSSGNSEKPDK
jgi:hypothetical protein